MKNPYPKRPSKPYYLNNRVRDLRFTRQWKFF